MTLVKPMKHQAESLRFMASRPSVLDFSDCGTGKTLVEILDFAKRHKVDGEAMLVLCPKSIMYAAWAQDLRKFAPHLKISLCYAQNRAASLAVPADVYVVNIDGAIDLAAMPVKFWKKFGTLVIDEADSIKHRTSNRSKAVVKIAKHFQYIRLMTGTPGSNGICDLWHLAFVADGGKRLGKSFFAFRSACCIPVQTGPSAQMVKWEDRPGVELSVAALLSDITIRHKFEDCVDIPANHRYHVVTQLSVNHRKLYEKLKADSYAEIGKTGITATNGAVLATKLLQSASGAVYNDVGTYSLVATDRYALVLDLAEARKHSVVFYLWDHQREELIKEAQRRKLTFAIWDSNKPQLEKEFQTGQYRIMFAHPASAGHGLTLTRATSTIWTSPTYRLDHFEQGLKRIHRIGQTQKTETIVVVAEDTFDEKVYNVLLNKRVRMIELFEAI